MSHHSQDDSKRDPVFKDLLKQVRGEFPDGRLNASDEGAQLISIGNEEGKVVIKFPTPTMWIGFNADRAIELAQTLITHARRAGSTKPLEIMR